MATTAAAAAGKGYHRLLVWQKAHVLVVSIYRATEDFPRAELFGLTSQMRRAACSVPANIVEGQVRGSDKEFIRFLSIANGSLTELEYYLELARDLSLLTPDKYGELEAIRSQVGALLHGFIKDLAARNSAV